MLFRSLLQRTLAEFDDLAAGALDVADAPVLAFHSGRMHKLRGVAGMLGALRVQREATDAEATCAVGDIDRASGLTATIAVLPERLVLAAAPSLLPAAGEVEVANADTGALAPPAPPAPPELIALLRKQRIFQPRIDFAASRRI